MTITTSAIDSRHGSSLLWCSKGPMNIDRAFVGRDVRPTTRTDHRGRPGCAVPRTPNHEVDRPGRSTAGEQDGVLVGGSDDSRRMMDAGFLAKAGRLQAGPRRLGVGVGIQREDRDRGCSPR